MVIKSIGPVSLAKLMGLLYTGLGLIFGVIFGLFSLVGGGAMMAAADQESAAGAGLMAGFGLAAVVLFPIFYGVLGFVAGLISAFLFNLAAKFAGGLEIEVQ
jgi:hypothetical protein